MAVGPFGRVLKRSAKRRLPRCPADAGAAWIAHTTHRRLAECASLQRDGPLLTGCAIGEVLGM